MLVALCFVAVMGLALASYLAVSNRAMQLSNRSFQSGLSRQLAEAGLDEALRAFNRNDWSGWASNPSGITGGTSAWTLDTVNKRATRTLTLDASKLGQGATATIKLRVDNYDANVVGVTWNSSTNYRVGDLVYYSGTATAGGNWYRSVADGNIGRTPTNALNYPDLNWWAPAPLPWMWNSGVSYKQYDVVCYGSTASGGTWYYSNTNSNTSTPGGANWTPMPAPALAILTFTTYYAGQFAFRVGDSNWYRCTATHTMGGSWTGANWTTASPLPNWAYNSSTTYSFNDLVFYSGTPGVPGTWYRCIAATSTGNVPTNTTFWENALRGSNTTSAPGALGWSSSSINYNVGDVVCYFTGGSHNFYRCIKAHTSNSSTNIPTNTTLWANTPVHDANWQPNRQYSANDVVRYKGIWFLSLASNNVGNLPMASNSSWWAAAPLNVPAWSSTATYELDDIVSSSGSWYRCIQPNRNVAVGNTAYWTPLTGSGSNYVWTGEVNHAVGEYRSYGGVWYRCINATTAGDGRSPNDTGCWTPTWTNGWGVTTGAPVLYAEATVTLGDQTTSRTQLRALVAPAPLFPSAIGSASTVTVGGGGTVESYDASVRAQNPSGTPAVYGYNETANAPFNTTGNANIGWRAVIAAAGTSFPSISLTRTTVKGYLATASNTSGPLHSVGTSGSVKSNSSPASPNVDTSRVSRSAYVPTFDILPAGGLAAAFSSSNFPRGLSIPTTGGFTSGAVFLGTPGAATPSRYFYNDDLVINGSTITTVNFLGPTVLYVNGNLRITGSGSAMINVYPAGSAEIHVAGSLMVDPAGNGIDNKTLDPKKVILLCDSAGTGSQYFSEGAQPLYGVIYAPNTTNSTGFNFGNASTTTHYGAVSARKINFANNATVRYDTSLRYATFGGVDQPYTVTQWRELDTTERATMP